MTRCRRRARSGGRYEKAESEEGSRRGRASALTGRLTMSLLLLLGVACLLLPTANATFDKDNIEQCARVLSEKLSELFERATCADEVPKLLVTCKNLLFPRASGKRTIDRMYEPYVNVEQYDPRRELRNSKIVIEKYIAVRAKYAYQAKKSLESRDVPDYDEDEMNDPNSKHFVRFMSAKQGTDATTIYKHGHVLQKVYVNATRSFNLSSNANFYALPTSPIASAVHVPTPLYDRNGELLRKIDWSDIDQVYRTNREHTRDLAFQMFCSESGFMRYYPAASWFWDNADDQLDLFDCRNTEWYINGATCSKNVLIMLDMSGSMLGQRYEIAKQTTEAILETLSHSDYFNIMAFSKTGKFLDDCNGEAGMLQATMRNKKMLRERMDNLTAEGKSEFVMALEQAFATLQGLPRNGIEWTTKDELALHPRNLTEGARLWHVGDHVAILSKEFQEALANFTTGQVAKQNPGCESVIMLITDGAPDNFAEVFKMHNPTQNVRFFSFLIGEEATEFEEVRHMACTNRGFMVHVANMADVGGKVQNYIRVLSRPIGKKALKVKEKDAIWSGVYRERLYLPRPEKYAEPVPIMNISFSVMNLMASKKKIRVRKQEARGRMFVTTVSYPVIVNKTFMGVAAVNIPLTEISQHAHPSMIGGRSYFFMLDENGFVMFHPQLRQIDPDTKFHKQNYNNMDILELEVPQSSQIRRAIMDCDNSDPQKIDMLFASEILDRVYPQTNTYYSECMGENNQFVLGLAVSKGDDYRLTEKAPFDYASINVDWVDKTYLRLHPHWRYCLLNDTDTGMSKEEAFEVYVRQMAVQKSLPDLCIPRRHLVDRLLLDLKATFPLTAKWETNHKFMQKNEAHVVFFASPSGMIRFYNISLDEFSYHDPNYDLTNIDPDKPIESYQHYITDTNRKSVDDRYYRRALRANGDIVFDVNYFSKLWYKNQTATSYGIPENITMLISASKSVYMDKAIIGVAGVEMGYDALIDILANHGCPIETERRWCVLLDEHAYVLYSNQRGIVRYADFYEPQGARHLGKWFGSINRVAQFAMERLVNRSFYTRYQYIDHQASCKTPPAPISMSAASIKPMLLSLARFFLTSLSRLLRAVQHVTVLPFLHHAIAPIEAYTTSFHDTDGHFACSKKSFFYFSNRDGKARPSAPGLIDNDRSARPCSGGKCSVKMSASFVEKTNLVMVWIAQDSSSSMCYDDTQCALLSDPNPVPFGFEPISNASRAAGYEEKAEEKCKGQSSKRSKTERPCFKLKTEDEKGMVCSGMTALSILLPLAICAIQQLLSAL